MKEEVRGEEEERGGVRGKARRGEGEVAQLIEVFKGGAYELMSNSLHNSWAGPD